MKKIKWSLFWIFVHSCSIWFFGYFLEGLTISGLVTNYFIYVLIMGLGITVVSKIVRSRIRKLQFKIDTEFFIWVGIFAFGFWIVRFLVYSVFNIRDGLSYFILMGSGVYLISLLFIEIFTKSFRSFNMHHLPNKWKHSREPYVNSENKLIINMVNRERKKRGLHPVVFDPFFGEHALKWSKHMAKEGKLSHSGHILENACMVPANGSPSAIAKRSFYCWKGSSPHWGWMMNPNISRVGFGYWIRGRYAYGAYAFNNP